MDSVIEILKSESWSKSDAFLLPLTGLTQNNKYPIKSYLFWKNYSIIDYNLILSIEYDSYEEFLEYCRSKLFPILDRNDYLIESYDFENRSIFVLDISEWAMDIEMFIAGKYSKFNTQTKNIIKKYHTRQNNSIPIYLYGVLYPNERLAILRQNGKDQSAIEYVAKNYGLDINLLNQVGEIGSTFNSLDETLITDIDINCQVVR